MAERELWTVGVGRNNESLLRALGRYFYLSNPAELAGMFALELFPAQVPVGPSSR